ncbi:MULTISPECIES: helix-turn-helix domain-containing protein [Anaerotruncus]|uniref:helix-turn-helix domain-containing protein n=1 Tax=Anaerotruncus TaxID=244127 RepID=UPI00083106B7|nr:MULTISPECIES: helix-turn-helix transcriptional regulator [Anaerotruncus]RGX55003.1 XRE family transcriptional regulator [Anaerotruncus sp. AF02-27]
MENMSKIIGSNIRKYRTLKKMTREQLAEAVDLDSAYLGQCERGERQLGLTKTIQIIEFFGVTANDIIAVSNKKSRIQKKEYLSEIDELLQDCTDNQALAILRIIQNALPFLKE